MVSINLPNIVTIGLIAVGATIALKWGLGLAGISPSWL
jgi:hypothetical protein